MRQEGNLREKCSIDREKKNTDIDRMIKSREKEVD